MPPASPPLGKSVRLSLPKEQISASSHGLETVPKVWREPRSAGTPSILTCGLSYSVSLICLSFGTIMGVIT